MRAQLPSRPTPSRLVRVGTLALAGLMLAASPSFADKPDWAGGGKGKGGGGAGKGGGKGGSDVNVNIDIRFGGDDRVFVRDYYGGLRGCPPGLAKKNNGCMPPGQAKKWAVGHPLPRDVVFYDLPHELVIKLRPPPSGYRYVRVAADILMIAVGTGLVIDAIEDLGRL